MNKKLGLRMAQGGLVQGDERAALYAKYGIKPGGSAPAPQPAPQPVAQPPAHAQKAQAGGLLNQATSALSGRRRQLEEAMNYAEGGIVRGKGGPTDDEVPMRVAGKDVNLSNTEAVLPAKTVQALGGPKAVEALIEQTNGKPPVKGGLRAGGEYESGAVAQPKQEDALKAPWWSPAYATAARLSDKSGLELERERRASAGSGDVMKSVLTTGTTGQSAPPPAVKPAAPAEQAAEQAAASGINVKAMTPEQRTVAADAYRNYVDEQTGTGPGKHLEAMQQPNASQGLRFGDMQKRIDAYAKDPSLVAARNAREDMLGSGLRMGIDSKGQLTINNTGDRSNGTLPAAGGTTMDMKGANEIYARANAVRGSMIDSMANANGPSGRGLAILGGGGGGGMDADRDALLKKVMTAHPGAQNGQLTAAQINAARGLMGDAQSEQLKAQELAINRQRAAMDGAAKRQELGLRAQEHGSLDAYRRGSLQNDAQKTAATSKAAAQANYLALSKNQREVLDGYVKRMVPTDGLKGDDLKAKQKEQADLTEAVMKATGGRLSLDPQELQAQLPSAIDQGRLTLAEREAALNPSLGARFNNLMNGNVERNATMYPTNTVTLSDGKTVQMPGGLQIPDREIYGKNADLRLAAEQRREQFAAQR